MLKNGIISLVIILALTLSACTPSAPNADKNQENANQNQTNNINSNNASYEDIKIAPKEAFDIFTEKHPNTKVEKLQLDFEDDSYIYEVEGYDDTKEYELKISSIDGNILKEEQDTQNKNDKQDEITLEDLNKIQDLIDRTLKDAGNDYKIDEWSLKSTNGQVIFEIEVINDNDHDIEYKYDAGTGDLIEKD